MQSTYEIGDLVHIPQAVELIDCKMVGSSTEAQLTIPLRVAETECPKVGVVTNGRPHGGYIRVYCEGNDWLIKNKSLYTLNKMKTQ
tara:strand:+ start:13696 stop:13953 length:258 start_codon:yes stop_codon:yes gene_type:complete